MPLPSSLAARPALRPEGTSNQALLFKKKMVVTRAPEAPQPQPAHLVSKQNPAAKVAEFPSPHPEYKAERLQTSENSPIPMRRHRIKAPSDRRIVMPRGDKSKYTDKQERKADHIAEGYEKRGVPEQEAERRPGQPSTKRMAAARSPAGLAAASLPAIRRRIRAARRAVQPRPPAQQRVVRRLRRRQRSHATGTRSSAPDATSSCR